MIKLPFLAPMRPHGWLAIVVAGLLCLAICPGACVAGMVKAAPGMPPAVVPADLPEPVRATLSRADLTAIHALRRRGPHVVVDGLDQSGLGIVLVIHAGSGRIVGQRAGMPAQVATPH